MAKRRSAAPPAGGTLYHPGETIRMRWPGYVAPYAIVVATVLSRVNQGSAKQGAEWVYEVLIEDQVGEPVPHHEGSGGAVTERTTHTVEKCILGMV